MKKTFAKKRNQRRTFYAISAAVIVSLLFVLSVVKAQGDQEKHELYQKIAKVEQEKAEKVEKLYKLSEALQTLKKKKAVTDTQLKQKAREEASMEATIENLKAELQAKKAVAPTVAVSYPSGGMGGSEGNTYSYGYCTWYVKNRRPDIPNNWGHAMTWFSSAQSVGWATGSEPRVGAVGTEGNHVVYIEEVRSDGTVLLSEMNYEGWNVRSERVAPATSFQYIY